MSLIGELEQGDIAGALRKIASIVETDFTVLANQFPALAAFIKQFASDFGQKVLADAEALAPAVLAGTTSIGAAAMQLVAQAGPQAASVASSDATAIAMNALGVYVHAVTVPAMAAA